MRGPVSLETTPRARQGLLFGNNGKDIEDVKSVDVSKRKQKVDECEHLPQQKLVCVLAGHIAVPLAGSVNRIDTNRSAFHSQPFFGAVLGHWHCGTVTFGPWALALTIGSTGPWQCCR